MGRKHTHTHKNVPGDFKKKNLLCKGRWRYYCILIKLYFNKYRTNENLGYERGGDDGELYAVLCRTVIHAYTAAAVQEEKTSDSSIDGRMPWGLTGSKKIDSNNTTVF